MRPVVVTLALALFFSAPARIVPADVIHACAMKSNGKLRMVASAGMCSAKETAVDWTQAGPASAPFKLAGFTTATVGSVGNLNAGVLEWTRACGAEFPGARACKSEEVIFAVDPPQISNPDDPAWVLPNVVSPGIDISGAGYGYSCANLTNNNSNAYGMTVDGHGRYSNALCTEAHRVACCVPSN